MLTVLSPAKRLDFETPGPTEVLTRPALLPEAEGLMAVAKGLSPADLRGLMSISEPLSELNHARFQQMATGSAGVTSRQAALAFRGDVYLGLDAPTLGESDLVWAQDRLAILSGLYGVLRPLDAIQPHRLEMGTRLTTPRGADLYAYWGDRVAREVEARLVDHAHPVVLNLASNEYFKVLSRGGLAAPVITPVFKELHKGKLKVLSFSAKRARGLMARWIVERRLDAPEAVKAFDVERYTFRPDLSDERTWLYTRTFVPVGNRPVATP